MASPSSPPPPTTRRRPSGPRWGLSGSRRRRRRRVVWLRVAALALGVGLLAELLVAALTSPRFGLDRVEVAGAQRLPNALIVSTAAIPEGANLLRLDRAGAARRVAALPPIRSAQVRRRLPRGIVIEVVERKPVVFVQAPGGRIYVDPEGIGFRLCGEDAPAVELVGISARQCPLGERVRDRRIPVVLGLCARARQEQLTLRRITVGLTGEMDLVLTGGAILRLGEAERLGEKLSKARQALEGLSDRGPIEYLDVSCPDAVVWKPAERNPKPGGRTGGGVARTTP